MEYWRETERWKNVTKNDWEDWRWQLRHAIVSLTELGDVLKNHGALPSAKFCNSAATEDNFTMKLTPFLSTVIERAFGKGDFTGGNAIINTFVPQQSESKPYNGGSIDGIGEESSPSKPVPLVTNFYRNRALLFATNICSAHCRFCFRRRKIGCHFQHEVEKGTDQHALRVALDHIERDQAIREVVVSGGDPLTLSDDNLLSLLWKLRAIDHIQILRLDTKVFTTLPQRITPRLVTELKKLRPLSIVGNFLHPIELTPEVVRSVGMLTDSGVPVFSHTALLKDVNDDVDTLLELMWNLYLNNIIPYYLIQFIPTKWTEHFRVPIETGVEIIKKLNSSLSGIAVPTYIVYLPNGAGKVPVTPNYLLSHTEEGYYFRNLQGSKVLYLEKRIHDLAVSL